MSDVVKYCMFVDAICTYIIFLPIQLGWHKTDDYQPYSGDKFICLLEFNKWYAVISSLVSFVVPCIIMFAINFQLFQFAQKHVKSIKKTWTTGVSVNGSPDENRQNSNQYKPSDHKATITLGIIMGSSSVLLGAFLYNQHCQRVLFDVHSWYSICYIHVAWILLLAISSLLKFIV